MFKLKLIFMNTITREEVEKIKVEELGSKLQELIEQFESDINKIDDVDTIKQLEDNLMGEMAIFEEYLKHTAYKLESSVTFNGVLYTKKDISDRIVAFLNKNEVEFQYVLGLQQLSELWRHPVDNIDYYKYDSTLRVLGQSRYKGYKEWTDILAINNYFSNCHEQYSRDTSFNIFLSKKHNVLMDRMQKLSGVDPATGGTEMVCEEKEPASEPTKKTKHKTK